MLHTYFGASLSSRIKRLYTAEGFVVLELKFATKRKQTKRHAAKVKTGKKAESRDSREELKLCNLFFLRVFVATSHLPTYLADASPSGPTLMFE